MENKKEDSIWRYIAFGLFIATIILLGSIISDNIESKFEESRAGGYEEGLRDGQLILMNKIWETSTIPYPHNHTVRKIGFRELCKEVNKNE